VGFDVALIVLAAAALNAGWNALIKVGGDRIASMAVVTLLGSLISILAVPFVAPPDPASWWFLAGAILIHTAYHFLLPVAYDHGDLGQVYPIARGSAPLLVTVGAAAVAGEAMHHFALLGTVCLAVGVMTLALEGRGRPRRPAAIIYALGTGVCIAAYTLIDGLGARQAISVIGFAVWLTVGDGILTFLIALLFKRAEITRIVRGDLRRPLLAGAMQVGAYWIIVWALANAPLGMVSALRETSVLFAAVLSTFVLGEGFGVWRFFSAGLVVLGVALTRVRN
jgi:drug/metabolite transporter (DMT)-like permease